MPLPSGINVQSFWTDAGGGARIYERDQCSWSSGRVERAYRGARNGISVGSFYKPLSIDIILCTSDKALFSERNFIIPHGCS